MSGQEQLFLRYRVRRRADDARDAPAALVCLVELSQSALRKTEPVTQDVDEEVINGERLLHERFDGGLHALVHGGGIRAMYDCWPGECVVFGDVDELGDVQTPAVVQYLGPGPLIATEKGGLICIYVANTYIGRTYPNDAPSSPCSNLLFSSNRRAIVSLPISNMSSISSTPWFLRLCRSSMPRKRKY